MTQAPTQDRVLTNPVEEAEAFPHRLIRDSAGRWQVLVEGRPVSPTADVLAKFKPEDLQRVLPIPGIAATVNVLRGVREREAKRKGRLVESGVS